MRAKRTEQMIKNAIMNWLISQPQRFFVFSVYNGGVYNPTRKCYQLNPSKIRGVSDIIGIVKWKGSSFFLACEIKTFQGLKKYLKNKDIPETTEYYEQEFLNNVFRMGGIAKIFSSLDECIEAFKEEKEQPILCLAKKTPEGFEIIGKVWDKKD